MVWCDTIYLAFPFSLLFSLSLTSSLSLSLTPSLLFQLAEIYAECEKHLGDLKDHYLRIAAPEKKTDQVSF